MIKIKHIAFENGTIRDANGKLIAFYDRDAKQLSIDGFAMTFFSESEQDAMEIVARRYEAK
jgi:hypothetical protein